MPPMGTNLGSEKGFVTDRLKAYYEARAKGGVGLVIVEIICVDSPIGNTLVGNLSLHDDDHIPGMAELTGAIQKHGARVAAQLFHAGVETHSSTTGLQPVGPSVVKTFTGDTPRELSLPEISDLIQRFAEAAARAKRAGFDAVEIHGATYYLITQFLSRYWNKRRDRYGGSLENRARFLLEVLKAIKKAVGTDFPVWCRINASEFGLEEGNTLEEMKQVAKWAESAGSDAIHVSSFGGKGQLHMGPIVVDHGILLPLAHEIKRGLHIPVIAVGRIDPEMAEKALAKGQANFIAMGRGIIADPELPNKLAEGKLKDIRPCICCLECNNHISYKRLPLRCSVNALCGKEKEYRIERAQTSKQVIVIGGGPGGMEAAMVAALRGHRVTLFEKRSQLGGLLTSAALPPKKEDVERLITYLKTQIEKFGVQVQLDKEISPEEVANLHPDAVVVACGASPCIPNIDGLRNIHALTAEEALLGKEEIGEKVLIIGGGRVGCETADYLSGMGKKITIVEVLEKMVPDMIPTLRSLLLDRLRKKGVNMLVGVKGEKIEASRMTVSDPMGKREVIEADTFIIATGATPRQEEWSYLKHIFKSLYFVGDTAGPRGIMEAIAEGNWAGRMI
jgi:2,4-dienoyl-CoA reductase-like NADH-dependent reductase (Old Yellow Enzyme family)/thioredoxin reductase